ncbi:hypothetical protein Tco_0787426 [Tanacetum coccineum]
MGGIFSIEARDMDMKLLLAPESNNTLAIFLSQMAHLVANIALNSASISPEGFMSSVLLWLVMIVAVVDVTLFVVIIVALAVVVESSFVVKLSFVIT